MAVNESDVLSTVKMRLGLSDEGSDALIASYISELGSRIKIYCWLTEVPDELTFTWVSMTIDLLKARNPEMPVIAALLGKTVELKVGDTTVKTTANKASVPAIVTNYAADLNPYRKLRW